MSLKKPVQSGYFQRGVGLPAAIFVITLLVTIAAAINLLVAQNAETFEEESHLIRAFYAAESGAGFAMNALFPPAEFPSYNATAICPDNVGDPRIYQFNTPGLAQCRAEVSCSVDAEVNETEYYTITSTGFCEDVQRTVQVRTSFQQ